MAVGRREEKKIFARKKIMEAALGQFKEKGFQAASVADIMKAADMGLGTFYNYFSSKEEILYSLMDSFSAELQERLAELRNRDEAQGEMLREMVLMIAKMAGENRFILPLFITAGDNQHEKTEKKNIHPPGFLGLFLQLVRSGQEKGEFRQDISAELIAEMFHSLFQAAAFSSLPHTFEENISLKLRMIIDGIMVKP